MAIALGFFVFNLTQIGRYGCSYDEAFGMERGRETVALIAGLIHHSNGVPADAPDDWINQHPSFYATCNYGVTQILIHGFGCPPIPAGHLLNLLTASAGLVVLFFLGQRLFNPRVGLVAVIFMVLFPRFIAHAHFNAKDVPVMVFGTLDLLLLHLAATRGQIRYWILAALGLAVAVTTKLDGLFVLPIFLIPWLIKSRHSDHRLSDQKQLGWFLLAAGGFIFLLWPELWIDPLRLIRSVANFAGAFKTHAQQYLGHTYAMNALPWHYIPLTLLAVTPILLLAAAGSGAIVSLYRLFQKQSVFELRLVWCWLLLPVLPRMLPFVTRYDGMRHVFLVVPALALLAGVAVDRLLQCRQNGAGRRLIPVGLAGALLWSGWQIAECHPCEAFYLNEGVRAIIPGPKLAKYFDFFGWGSLYTSGGEWINAHAPPQATVAASDEFYMSINFTLRKDLKLVRELNQADYAMVGCWNDDLISQFHSPPAFSVRCYGTDLLCVFARPNH